MPPDSESEQTSIRRRSITELAERLEKLCEEMRQRHLEAAEIFERVHPRHRLSAANLLDYLTLRRHDMRDIQDALAELGLSSLGRAEERLITSRERALDNLHLLGGDGDRRRTEAAVSYKEGRRILESNTLALLGPNRPERSTRILVTMPSEAYHIKLVAAVVIILTSTLTLCQESSDSSKRYVPPEFQASDPEVRALLESAENSASEGRYSEGKQSLQKALARCVAGGLVADKAIVEDRLAGAYFVDGKLDDAKQQWRNALSDGGTSKNLALQADVLVAMSAFSQVAGN